MRALVGGAGAALQGALGAGHRARALAGLQGSKEIPLRALHPARGTWDAGDRAHSPETACPAACSAVVEMLPVGTARHDTGGAGQCGR